MVSDCSSIQIKIQAHFDRSIHCQHNIANVAEIKYCLLFVSLKPSKESKKAEIRNKKYHRFKSIFSFGF